MPKQKADPVVRCIGIGFLSANAPAKLAQPSGWARHETLHHGLPKNADGFGHVRRWLPGHPDHLISSHGLSVGRLLGVNLFLQGRLFHGLAALVGVRWVVAFVFRHGSTSLLYAVEAIRWLKRTMLMQPSPSIIPARYAHSTSDAISLPPSFPARGTRLRKVSEGGTRATGSRLHGHRPARFAPHHVLSVLHLRLLSRLSGRFGILAPARLAFDRAIAVRCFSALAAPNFLRVRATARGVSRCTSRNAASTSPRSRATSRPAPLRKPAAVEGPGVAATASPQTRPAPPRSPASPPSEAAGDPSAAEILHPSAAPP